MKLLLSTKLVAAAFLAVLLALAAMACGGGTTPAAKVPPPTQPAQQAAKPAGPAWQARWDTVVKAAKQEGKVLVYTSANPATRQALAAGFEKKFGIAAEFIAGREEEFSQKILSERRAGLFLGDILIGGPSGVFRTLKPEKVLQDVSALLILPEVTDPNLWHGKALPILDQEKQIFSFVSQAATLTAVNTDLVKDNDIKSYKDILDPRWKGKIIMDDPTVAGAASSWTQMMLAIYGPQDGRQFLENLLKQSPVLLRDKRLVVESLARGKYAIAIGADIQTTSDFKKLGSPIRWLKPIEGGQSLAGGGSVEVLSQPAHPNAAAVFVNWLLSKEGQTIFKDNYGAPSARVDVSTEGIDPAFIPREGEKLVMADEKWYMERPKLMETNKQIFGPLMK